MDYNNKHITLHNLSNTLSNYYKNDFNELINLSKRWVFRLDAYFDRFSHEIYRFLDYNDNCPRHLMQHEFNTWDWFSYVHYSKPKDENAEVVPTVITLAEAKEIKRVVDIILKHKDILKLTEEYRSLFEECLQQAGSSHHRQFLLNYLKNGGITERYLDFTYAESIGSYKDYVIETPLFIPKFKTVYLMGGVRIEDLVVEPSCSGYFMQNIITKNSANLFCTETGDYVKTDIKVNGLDLPLITEYKDVKVSP